ncbi:DEAD/DEAH box helicase [Corynebacterium macginleyi]|uniref:DEAD/DEAH box helicase n=1 Tax=Corynebacterium macginleyi TaxID=38290 RepID=A0A3M0GGY4_9CORY|nr:DEAD/DEAH box helicase [Corynebacterium macginleyi]MBK4140901.1 DEAD/DEAH box helicase [Corynebacterium macginleyi]MBK4143208.1 DEAD/DEAH box helicase [Corynebacterium macginleyi]MBK4157699.1 DEAD/DEAH box helicase [Corynebacterium macginleyi]MBK4161237.1 DEAD/DEAH box helicase [Corynebacterium macginleyi]MBK4162519.1 DEAD/DEAH box helicase [Corynebacterium macginleyi]
MTTFAQLGLPQRVVHVLHNQGITEAFPIQAAAIPDVLAGKDVLGRGPTGSGKTFTFGLPTLARLAGSGASTPGRPRAVVLAPTRELALQIQQRLDEPAAAVGLRVLAVVGGVNINHHIRSLARPVDLLVATPGRALDLIAQGRLSFDKVQITTLDEADQMADMGFLPQVRKLLGYTPPKGQRLLFSATLDGDVNKLVEQFLHDPVVHSTAAVTAAVESMSHHLFLVGDRPARNEVVMRIAARAGKTIMFMRTKHGVDRQVKKLRRAGINAYPLHGDKGQGARTRAISGFADGTIPVLVATDIAARGIDIAEVSLVVHVDPPAEHKAYLHRAGRTARGGATGTVVTLATDEQRSEVATLLKKAGVRATEHDISHRDNPAGAPELRMVTGARKPHGPALAPPGQDGSTGSGKQQIKQSPNQQKRQFSRARRGRGRSH